MATKTLLLAVGTGVDFKLNLLYFGLNSILIKLISGVAGNLSGTRYVTKDEIKGLTNIFLKMFDEWEVHSSTHDGGSYITNEKTVIGLTNRKVCAVHGYVSFGRGKEDVSDIKNAKRYRVHILALAFKK